MMKSINKWLGFFDRKSKLKFFFLICLILVINAMEVLGIGMLYPLIENLVDPSNSILNDITARYPFFDIKAVIALLIVVYFLKFILSIYFFHKKLSNKTKYKKPFWKFMLWLNKLFHIFLLPGPKPKSTQIQVKPPPHPPLKRKYGNALLI